jgi:murein DD-endopeptidase MepM/ murein hydrolase activator NlpD
LKDDFCQHRLRFNHQKILKTMKGLLILVVIAFGAFVLINNFAPNSEYAKNPTEKSLAPFRYASLLAGEPETKIQVPIRRIKAKQISDTFQAPRGKDRLHQGQDIFAPRNTPVYSATSGYVWRIAENKLGGNTVWVLGAGGRVYYYAHLESYAPDLKAGDAVTPETVLGFVGTSGNAKGTPPHLHFGVYTQSGAINPLTLFN